jgi:C1A family cysteine protease
MKKWMKGELTFVVAAAILAVVPGAETVTAASVPAAYMNSLADLTEKYPAIRNQGDYNTCWAFSAIGLAEFDLITDDKIYDKSIDLSEYQLSYFSYHNAEDAFGGTYGDSLTSGRSSYLMIGGALDYCSRTLLQWQGVTDESVMPYTQASALKSYSSSYAFGRDVAHLQNVYMINIHTNQKGVKQEIQKHGSAGIGLYMNATSQFVNTASYDKTGETVATYYCSNSRYAPNHALNIVGWDDDFPASAFSVKPEGNGAWLVRNSWSDKTENDIYSYFWLSYYDKTIEDNAWIFDFEPADNYDYNYQYDGCTYVKGLNSLVSPNLSVKKYANVFQVQGASNELLQAVSIALNEDTNVSYTIKIYANLTDPAKPKSGILAATVKGKTSYAGTYTVPLGSAVSIPKGAYYSVVVELGKAGNGIDAEVSASDYSSGLVSTAYADYNQSFIYKDGKWTDLAEFSDQKRLGIGNLCIKAYTDKTGASIKKTQSLKSVTVKKTSAKLSWAATDGAAGYEVYRATSKNGTYTKVATVKKKSYTDTKLKKNTTYYYKVRAYKKSGSTTVYGKLSGAVKIKTKKK